MSGRKISEKGGLTTILPEPKIKNKTDWTNKASILCECLPYVTQFANQTFVIKFGGSAMGVKENMRNFARDVALLKSVGINVVVVHGGGPQITDMITKLKIRSEFVDGMRITDKDTIEVVEMVLCGMINKQIVQCINEAGGTAVGISGKDASLIRAEKMRKTSMDSDSNIERIIDLGFVGYPSSINTEFFESIEDSSIIPVIAPVGFGADGTTYNMNADIVAGVLSSSLSASKLIILSDVDGVCDKNGKLIPSIGEDEVNSMIQDGSINKGMIPKVTTCLDAVSQGVSSAHIINGNNEHALLIEILTDTGIGTMIKGKEDFFGDLDGKF